MKFDIFFSICQNEVEGFQPSEKQMLLNFFDQVKLADQLGFGTAWVAETHLSTQAQKQNPGAVVPHFKGEIGLNTDIFQLAHLIFAQTKKINVGSAICNLLCNGGPMARAESVRTFLSFQEALQTGEPRLLDFGFAAGRFPFSIMAYGIKPRNDFEILAWDVLKNKVFAQATEIFLRFIRGEVFSMESVRPLLLREKDFRQPELWSRALEKMPSAYLQNGGDVQLPSFYNFEKVGVIPFESPLENLRLTIGSHDPEVQVLANEIFPVGVFNLSITSPEVIEETHRRMAKHYHKQGGPWRRELMPRTDLVFIHEDSRVAKERARKAWQSYWTAMEKTLDPLKVESAVDNAIAGNPEEVIAAMKTKYHSDDKMMVWFDFNNHNSEEVKSSMRLFSEKVMPEFL